MSSVLEESFLKTVADGRSVGSLADQITVRSGIFTNVAINGTLNGTLIGDFILASAPQVLTHKTITDATNNISANSLKTTSASVTVALSAPPITNQILRATSATTAGWSTEATALVDNTTFIVDAIDPTKRLGFDVTGTTATTATLQTAQTANRTYTIPDSTASCNFVMTAGDQSITGIKSFNNLAVGSISEIINNAGVTIDGIQIRRYTIATPALTLAGFEPIGTANDISIGLICKGNGGIVLTTPNNAISGGNARGINAIDLQISRNASTKIASGDYSATISGLNNSSAGAYSATIGGTNNTASGNGSILAGGDGNTTTAALSGIFSGQNNIITSSQNTAIIGGIGNHINALSNGSIIGAGIANNITGSNSVICGGSIQTINANNSGIVFGSDCLVTGTYAVAGGRQAKAAHAGAHVYSDNNAADFSSTDVNQWSGRFSSGFRFMGPALYWNDRVVIYVNGAAQTIGATTQTFIIIPTTYNTVYLEVAELVAIQVGTTNTAAFKRSNKVVVTQTGGFAATPTFDNSQLIDAPLTGADVAFNTVPVNVAGQLIYNLYVTVTGVAGATINWRGEVRVIRYTYA